MAIVACAGRITMDADCLWQVGIVAGAEAPKLRMKRLFPACTTARQEAYGKTG